ncbi:MAG TPA: TonB-dependent receptor [Chitinophagaceae bacterium]|nr:TonB-dependent receptor [Chitinophagaceae bacterium]
MARILKTIGIYALACCFPVALFAQGKRVSGTVTASDNKLPLPGVTVTAKESKATAVTDAFGHFTITVSDADKTLVFTSASLVSKEVAIVSGANDVELNPDVKELSATVVIGYQTIRRRDVLASVASISAKDIKDIPINSAAEMLNGRLAGVTATTSEGSPDANIRIRVRGGMSISQDNSPLFIVDGVQVENGLNVISPQDIANIDVLKDAAATAIYGARGSNGVIIITTKSGRAGKFTLSYNGFVGVKSLPDPLAVLHPYDFVIYQSERSRGSNTDSTSFTNNYGHTWDTLANYMNVPFVDWQEEVFGNTGVIQTHNIVASGGSRKITYNFSYTNNNDRAIVINSQYVRNLINLKLDYKPTGWLRAGIGARYTHQDVYGAGVSDEKGSSYNRLRNAVKYRPFLSKNQDIDDSDPFADVNVGNGLNLTNPLLLAGYEYRKKTTEAFDGNAYVNVNIFKHLSFRSTFGYGHNEFVDRQFNDSLAPYSIVQGGKRPTVQLDTVHKNTITNSNVFTLSYHGVASKHDFDLILGEETYDLHTSTWNNFFKSYPLGVTHDEAFSKTGLAVPFGGFPKFRKTRYTNLSFFGRFSYAFMEKYLLSFNVRADGASKFGPQNKWGYFPAGSVAWRVKAEKFMQNVDWLSDLKFRAGFGTVGNNRIDDYLFLTTFLNGSFFYGVNGTLINAYTSAGLVNENLKWESTVNRNFGMDIALFKNRVSLSADYYKNTSRDLLLNVPIASTYGYALQLQNIGKTENKGFEFQLNAGIIRHPGNGLNWTADFNISFNKNKILALGSGQQYFYPAASWGVSGQPTDYIERIGDPVGSFWGLVTDGFYKVSDFDYNNGIYTLKAGTVTNVGIIGPVMPGSIRFKDLNGDGVIDLNNDRRIIGNPTPKFTGGFANQVSFKNWDMSVFMNFSVGNDVYNANKVELTNAYSNNSNMLDIMAGRWKVVTATGATAEWISGSNVMGIPPDQLAALNSNATIWQPLKSAGAFYPHSWAIEDGSFLRINNITIGYTIPEKVLRPFQLAKMRIYVTANNVAVFTKYTGYDPEVSVRTSPLTPGLDYSAYPKSRSFIFGVNVTF